MELPFSDWDFYGGKVEDPIIIEGDIVDVPDEIASLDTIGFNYKLHKSDGSISSDLSNEEDGDTLALTIRLVVDDSLEPNGILYQVGMMYLIEKFTAKRENCSDPSLLKIVMNLTFHFIDNLH